MLKSFFKIAWRNITAHKTYTAINVMGLALGICACICIYLITSYELSFDKFHPDKDRIYRVVGEIQRNTGEKEFLNCPISDVAAFQEKIPGFESESGFHLYSGKVSIPNGKDQIKKFDNKIEGSYQSAAIITWPEYFDVFKYEWLSGNAKAFAEPFKVVLSENRARKYFGNMTPDQMIGKVVIYDDSLQVKVAGIIKDWTQNTDFGYTDFISIATAKNSFLKNWIPTQDWSSLRPHNAMAFVKLERGISATQINARFARFIKENVKMPGPGFKLNMWLQPLTDIHFTKEFHRDDDGDDFRKPYLPTLYALMGVALFILVIAIVNFINLSTAQSVHRAKEIGVRKVLGSGKKNIVSQFLIETLIITLFSVMVSLLLLKPVLQLFSDYVPDGIILHPLRLSTFIFLLVVTFVTVLLAGYYPAKVLSAYLPVLSLKGSNFQKGSERLNMRKALIVFQFTISLVFIIGSLVIGKQISFMNKADKGFNSDAVIIVNHWRDRDGKLKVFAENIKQIHGVHKVIMQSNAPMGFAHGAENIKYKNRTDVGTMVSFEEGTEDFIPFYQMRIIAGRNIAHSDSLNELVINETYSKLLRFAKPQEAIGKFLYTQDGPHPVVGVVADFHEGDFHEVIKPVVIGKKPEREWSVAIKLTADEKKSGDVKSILSEMEKQWKKIYPEEPFNYNFLNETITWLYGQEEKTAWLVNIAMYITIFISCMGLFGLSMFTAQRKTKEIGIRKVLGASVSRIAYMLSKDFVILVVIAIVISSPIAWYFTNRWLADFAYRTNINWSVFTLAGITAILIAIITISFQAIKAATANPAESLRTE